MPGSLKSSQRDAGQLSCPDRNKGSIDGHTNSIQGLLSILLLNATMWATIELMFMLFCAHIADLDLFVYLQHKDACLGNG